MDQISHITSTRQEAVLKSSLLARPEDIDRWFKANGYNVESPKPGYQQYNFRRIHNKKNGKEIIVAYKTDRKLNSTGNIFIETISVLNKTERIQGWAYDDRIDAFAIYSPQQSYFWFIPKTLIDQNIETWTHEHKTRTAQNSTYETQGIIVPEPIVEASGAKKYYLRDHR